MSSVTGGSHRAAGVSDLAFLIFDKYMPETASGEKKFQRDGEQEKAQLEGNKLL